MFPGQSERTRFPVDGGDFPEGRASVHKGVVVDDGADDGGVVEDDGGVWSGHELGVGGGARQAQGVGLGVAALHGIGQEMAHGREKARAGVFLLAGGGGNSSCKGRRRGSCRREGAKEMLAKRKENRRRRAKGPDDARNEGQQHRGTQKNRSRTGLRSRENNTKEIGRAHV